MEILLIVVMGALIVSSGIYIGSVRGITWIMSRIYNKRHSKRKRIYIRMEV